MTEEYLVGADIENDFSQRIKWQTEEVFPGRVDFLVPSTVEMSHGFETFLYGNDFYAEWAVLAGKNMQGKVLEVSERLREKSGNNLHDYYRQSEKRQNYAGRLVQLTEVASSVMKFHSERNNTMHLAQIFDIFHVGLPEPDLFDFWKSLLKWFLVHENSVELVKSDITRWLDSSESSLVESSWSSLESTSLVEASLIESTWSTLESASVIEATSAVVATSWSSVASSWSTVSWKNKLLETHPFYFFCLPPPPPP